MWVGPSPSLSLSIHVIEQASEQGQVCVFRIGQIISDTIHMICNATGATPMILQAATMIGAITKLGETPVLPVDIVVNTVVNISPSNAEAGVMNVVNDSSFRWTRDILPARHRAGLQLEELGQKEWGGSTTPKQCRSGSQFPHLNLWSSPQ
jgi:hypothetical protein